MATTIQCNMCGKTLDEFDLQEHFSIHQQLGYGSAHDGDIVDLDLCCGCFDKILEHIAKQCAISPIKAGD